MDLSEQQADFLTPIRQLAHEVCQREGCRLYDLEFTGGPRGRILRIFVEREQGTVSLDDCANVSRGLNLLLDVEDIVPGGNYELEVSSPGVERRLREVWHFERALGQPIRVRLIKSKASSTVQAPAPSLIEGRLVRVDENCLYVELADGQEQKIEIAQIEKANVRFEPTSPQSHIRRGKKKKKR